ncbi:MAG: hypothetical protein Q9213_002477 [Squamulea squamosa]
MAIPWEQTSLFVRTSDRRILPGGPTAYNPLRPTGVGHNGVDVIDVTSFHPGQWDWNPTYLPEILYVYMSPKARDDFYNNSHPKEAPPKYDAEGNEILERWPETGQPPRPLLDYPHLPDQVGAQESWWVFETWKRLDRRITWKDIHMRQYGPNRTATDNTIQKLVGRARVRNYMIAWESGQKPAPMDAQGYPLPSPTNKVAALISERKKRENTTRDYTPGLRSPRLGEIPGNRIFENKTHASAGRRRTKTARGVARGGRRGDARGGGRRGVRGHRGSSSRNSHPSERTTQDDTEDADDQPTEIPGYDEATSSLADEESRIAYDHRGAESEHGGPLSEDAGYSHASKPGKRQKLTPTTERGARSGQRSAVQTPATSGTHPIFPQHIHTDIADPSPTRTAAPLQMPPLQPSHPLNPPHSMDPARLQDLLLQRVARVLWLQQQQQDPLNHPPRHNFRPTNLSHRPTLAEDEPRLSRGRNQDSRTYYEPRRRPRYDESFVWSNQDQEEMRRRREGEE